MYKKIKLLKKGNLVDEVLKEGELEITGIYDGIINLNYESGQGLALVKEDIIMTPVHLIVSPFPKFASKINSVIFKYNQFFLCDNLRNKIVINNLNCKVWNGFLLNYNLSLLDHKEIKNILSEMLSFMSDFYKKNGLIILNKYWNYLFFSNDILNLKNENFLVEKFYFHLQDFLEIDDFKLKIEKLSSVIGFGLGLTPSGDDFLIGFLSVLYLYNSIELKYIYQLDKKKYYKKTTKVSSTALWAAIKGSFNENIINFYRSLTKEKTKLIQAMEELSSIGNTSGLDMLTGIIFGFIYKNYKDF